MPGRSDPMPELAIRRRSSAIQRRSSATHAGATRRPGCTGATEQLLAAGRRRLAASAAGGRPAASRRLHGACSCAGE
eukprot:4031444-Alexandrium_andersonii.AAC.1